MTTNEIHDLVKLWKNRKRKEVIERLSTLQGAEAVMAGFYFRDYLPTDYDIGLAGNMLQTAAEKEEKE